MEDETTAANTAATSPAAKAQAAAESKLTPADLDKAAEVFEQALEQLILSPDPTKAGQIRDLMDALDALDTIHQDLTGDVGDVSDDPGDK